MQIVLHWLFDRTSIAIIFSRHLSCWLKLGIRIFSSVFVGPRFVLWAAQNGADESIFQIKEINPKIFLQCRQRKYFKYENNIILTKQGNLPSRKVGRIFAIIIVILLIIELICIFIFQYLRKVLTSIEFFKAFCNIIIETVRSQQTNWLIEKLSKSIIWRRECDATKEAAWGVRVGLSLPLFSCWYFPDRILPLCATT